MAELDAVGCSCKWTQTTNISESEDALRRAERSRPKLVQHFPGAEVTIGHFDGHLSGPGDQME